MPQGVVGTLAIPFLTPDQVADPARRAVKYRIPLINQVAVLGSARDINASGVTGNAALLGNGAEAVARANLPLSAGALRVTPFLFGGVGWTYYNIVNNDVNQANAVVGACPDLYNIVATSRSRGSADTITLPYSPGLTDDFLQGLYDVSITSAKAMSAYFAESVSVYSGRTLTHALRAEDVDSTQMPSFTLTVYNESTGTFAHTLSVRYFTVGGATLGTVTTGTPKKAFAANACALMVVENSGVVYDQFVMPYGNYTRYVQNPPAGSPQPPYTLTVTNGGTQTNQLIVAQANGLVLGTVYKRKTQTFSVPSNPLPNPPIPAESAGTPVNFLKQNGVTVLSSQTLAANTTLTIP